MACQTLGTLSSAGLSISRLQASPWSVYARVCGKAAIAILEVTITILICETYNSNLMWYKSYDGPKSEPIQNGDGAKVVLVEQQKVNTSMHKPMGDRKGSELVNSDSE